ncbi:VWA domain-containing protein [Paenibacillus paeoniae]|uniref:VWA domain-containing protein n=1 Tax=Paenibacillus paeoniae TaxID=2292705 RepID=A0A371PK71_9BACL|nr:VWA domain-containing protein [Paenibacillus paeoniae]REK76608.1 VWA domain-containing protein [Paenibacillus paeoniae]
MGIQAEFPWVIILLAPWLAYIIWMYRHTPRLGGVRKHAAIAVRSLIMLLLIVLLAGIQPYRSLEQRHIVFVGDRSASMNNESQIGSWISEAWSSKSDRDTGAIVSIGLHAVTDRSRSSEPLPSEGAYPFRTVLNDRYTDLSRGLQMGASLLGKDGGRIILLSDGAQNVGDLLRQSRLLHEAGITVDTVHIATESKRDAAIDELIVPRAIKQGESFSFQLTVQSTFDGNAEIRLYEDDQELSASAIQLERGENRFSMQGVALKPGFHRYRAEIHAAGDEQSLNNTAYAFSRVSGPPTVLIVEGQQGSSGNIEEALAASMIGYETISPEQLSLELAQYAMYDSILLHNVPATRIAKKPMEWLGRAVGDYGVGLVMLGGEDSFGLGGYFHTPIERASPVYMDLQGRKQIPSLGLILVIDRSGSMSDGKMELAKEAAIRTVELLRDIDQVGVIAFDSAPVWIVEPTALTDRDEVITKIQGIQADGGTEIYSALAKGYEGLLQVDAQRKHMILLTDGQSAGNENYESVIDGMNGNEMTLSTVAIGDGADQTLLEWLAAKGKGRYYFTKDQSTIPAIFSRETVLMSRTYIVEGEMIPTIGQAGDWNRLWQNGMPEIRAYVAATPKELAEVALWSHDGDPILSRWTYGAGRSVAWTSDMTGKWAPDWVTWSQLPQVLTEWVKWTFPQFDSAPYRARTEASDGSVKLIVESTGGADTMPVEGLGVSLEGASGIQEVKRLMPVAPGRYETSIHELAPGAYLSYVGGFSKNGDTLAVTNGMATGFVVPYGAEYRIGSHGGDELLANIAVLTGGRVLGLDEASESYKFQPAVYKQSYDWSRDLLLIVLVLWLADIAIRRLSIPWTRVGHAGYTLLRKKLLPGKSVAVAIDSSPSVFRLRKRASERSRFYEQDSSTGGTMAKIQSEEALFRTDPQSSESIHAERLSSNQKNTPQSQKEERMARAELGTQAQTEAAGAAGSDKEQVHSDSSDTINRLLAAKRKTRR